jgi:hypothetical protein
MCVDCILASPIIAQADPGRRTPPRGGTVTIHYQSKLDATHICSYTSPEMHQRRYEVIFGVLTSFCCSWAYFIVCGFSRTISTCVCFFSIYESLVVCA